MMNVYIADDEASIREGLKCIIDWNALGFEVCGEAGNGEDALHDILELHPDLVLLDIRMPRLQGTEIVKAAREHHFKGRFIILSGFSDFKYAQTAIRYGVDFYLVKPIDEKDLTDAVKSVSEMLAKEKLLTSAMKQYNEEAKRTILRDLFLNTGDLKKIDLDEMNLSASVYQIIIYNNYNQGVFKLMYRFSDLLKLANTGNDSFESISIDQKDIILLKGSFVLDRFRDFLRLYEFGPQKGSPLDTLFLTYGRPVNKAEDIHYSYEDASALLNRRFFCEQNQHTVGYEHLPDFENCSYKTSSEETRRYCEKLCEYMQSHNQKSLVETLLSLEKNLFYSSAEIPGIKLFLTDIFLQVKQTMNHIYCTSDIPFPANASIIDLIENKYYLHEIIMFFSEQFKIIMNAIGSATSENVIDDVLSYINQNYRDNIKLDIIAPLFGYNSSYLGKIFNKKMGESFNSYIDHVRIDNSKVLLLQNNMKVYEIAEYIGYKSVDYFHKKFKKYVGVSPAEFKKK